MKNFCLIVNRSKDVDHKITHTITRYLEEHKVNCIALDLPCSYEERRSNELMLPEDTDCVITLGGDGTLIRAARSLNRRDIPIMGVNLGHLGFLAEIDKEGLFPSLDRLLSDDYQIEDRMMIHGVIYKNGSEIVDDIALNDIVLNRLSHMHVIDFDVYVDGAYLMNYRADGMIVSTPTGSTAYNLSAGGPLVAPTAQVVTMTPICAHALNARCVIIDASGTIEIRVKATAGNVKEGCVVAYDGDHIVDLDDGDMIRICRSDRPVRLIKFAQTSFIELLRKKMQ
ncbi:MAG: NAD(+)/NADH kinase [Lachnospiraceae bacterium]|nr:NAD(+)/NADH kinase [Lachnospiraceae bacterium]